MSVFGKKLFQKKKIETQELYDFAQHGLIGRSGIQIDQLIQWEHALQSSNSAEKTKKIDTKKKPDITPKNLYKLEALNTPDLALNCDPVYLDKEIKLIERKAKLIPSSKSTEAKIRYGKRELERLAECLQNRKAYTEHQDYFKQYPYTTSGTIEETVAGYSNLKTKRVEEFIPDLPMDAIEAMESYNEHVMALCDKKAVFYIIADKKDFEKSYKKRDPVLLAQSPFGLVWQILGAWDEEMVLLEEL